MEILKSLGAQDESCNKMISMEVPRILLGVQEGFSDSFHHWGPLLMHEPEGGQNETSASKAGRMHGRQQGQSGDSDLFVMITPGWASLVGSWPGLPFFIRAPDNCTGAKVNLLPGDIPRNPSCLIPSGSCQPLRMIYGQAQRKGKQRLERGLRKCDNSSAPNGAGKSWAAGSGCDSHGD